MNTRVDYTSSSYSCISYGQGIPLIGKSGGCLSETEEAEVEYFDR
ncbi:hypothetical protein AB6E88_11745 [Providencia hangzhouensis]